MSVALASLPARTDKLPPMAQDGGEPEVWTLAEAASYLRMSPTKLRNLARTGDVPGAFRLGKPWLFRADELRKLGKPKD